jgi:hypothetical protein
MGPELNRREFLGTVAVGAAALGLARRGATAAECAGADPLASLPVTRIRKIYLAKPVPTWPKPDLDVAAEIQAIDAELEKLADRLGGIRLEGGDLFRAMDGSDLPASAETLGDADGLLVFNLTSTMYRPLRRLAAMGLPTILFSRPFAGHDWSVVPALRAQGHPVICLSTSDFGELPQVCRLIRTIHLLRSTRVLYVNTGPISDDRAKKIRERTGVEVVSIGPDDVNEAYDAVDEQAAAAEARAWIQGAVAVVEPSEQDIVASSRLYLALRKLLTKHRAQAVTINCLGLFRMKKLPAYPCLAFSKLNNLGLTGVCEADLDSTLTQLMFTYAFGIPGFVSDPVIDTSNNAVIHAHCVSATRMDGPDKPAAPYRIRTHMEDNKGAALQVQMRVGQVVTVAKLVDRSRMLISTGTITGNPDLDRGCRTKITTTVSNAKQYLNQYGSGLHRVIFYGDRIGAIEDLGRLMGFEVVKEC